MLGHLITYLRKSLPRAEESISTAGEELEAIETHRPEVAFLDIRMPRLTGLEVATARPS
jgi:CheY-like chemotaxis protein